MIRTAAEMADVVAQNPFPDAPGNRTVAIFLDAPPPPSALYEHLRMRRGENTIGPPGDLRPLRCGHGTLEVMTPAAKTGTARNMNTVAKLASMAKERP